MAVAVPLLKGACGLGLVIFVHELGHFLVAKACGVKCEKFYIGFDPPFKIGPWKLPSALFKRQWGETEYGIGIIPLGGYVKMLGQDDNPSNAAAEAERARTDDQRLDPRSYPAKSVPQRMAIISAGVVMNLIFAVLFGAAAYRMGLKYQPCVISTTSVGDPAWEAGIQPGERIVQIGTKGRRDQHLRFMNDLKVSMFGRRPGEDMLLVLQRPDGSTHDVTLQPNNAFEKQAGTPTIGIAPALDKQVLAMSEESTSRTAGLLPGDLITGLAVDGQTHAVSDYTQLQTLLASHPRTEITLTVDRKASDGKSTETHEILVPPQPVHRVGLLLEMGPIQSVQHGSVAEQAGLRVGDTIEQVNGEPISDPLALPQYFTRFIGQPVTLTVRRGEAEIAVPVTPVAPRMAPTVQRSGSVVGLEALGVGYVILPRVHGLLAGSSAERQGVQVGDKLLTARLVPSHTNRNLDYMLERSDLDKVLPLDDKNNNLAWLEQTWLNAPMNISQSWKEPVKVVFDLELELDRDGQKQKVRLTPAPSETLMDAERGIYFASLDETRRAASWGEALALGFRETKDGMGQVLMVLGNIGKSYKNLGGPFRIVAAATAEASEGLPRLLAFLTLLSANLAVVNFLPIPVLDGGHMLFLAYEGIVGKPANERVVFGMTLLGFSFLLTMMVFVLGLDIQWLTRFLG
jgi:regulator of sigma E protease